MTEPCSRSLVACAGILLTGALLVSGCSDPARTLHYANGKPWSRIRYKDDLPHGTWTTWHENGKKKSEGDYRAGEKHGRWTTWFENGELSSVSDFLAGRRDGLWEQYYESGQLAQKGRYSNSKLEGKWIEFYGNGVQRGEANYRAGKRHGDYIDYHKNGELLQLETYRDGVRHGPYKLGAETGFIHIVGEYDQNQQAGRWTYYNQPEKPGDEPTLNKAISGIYEAGKRVGEAALSRASRCGSQWSAHRGIPEAHLG